MVLNYIWIAFFLIAFVVAVIRLIFFGDIDIFPDLVNSAFSNAKTGFDISLALTGVLTLWLGFMKIGERGGIVRGLSRLIGPLFNRLFPELPKNHSVFGTMMMNLSANMLGLDNAATPMGLKAMEELQKENINKDTATNAQIMFLVLNTSGLTIIPVTIMAYRAKAENPSDVFIPILLATFFSTLAGIISVSIVQKIKLWDKVILGYLGGLTAFICGIIYWISQLPKEQVEVVSKVGANFILFSIIILFIIASIRKRVNVYDAFIDGAKEGFQIAIKIIPYLVAMLVAIGMLRTSGAMDFATNGIKEFCIFIGIDTRFVDALPTALMKPLSGSGARGMMLELFSNPNFGVDSFAAKIASTVQGATDTTFYIIAVYFGSVGIKKTRHAIGCGLIADLAGIIASIVIGYMFFG